MKYDVFLSYRRKGGFETAKHLFDLLTKDGYKVCLDLDTLREGDFDKALLARIDDCQDFILIVDSHAFERSVNPDFDPQKDWLRQELAYALAKGKNIVPVLLAGAVFPDNLPPDICQIAHKHGPSYSMEYFDSFYNKLKKFLHTKRALIRKTWLLTVLAILIIVGGGLLLYLTKNRPESQEHGDSSATEPETTIVQEPQSPSAQESVQTPEFTTTESSADISNKSNNSIINSNNAKSIVNQVSPTTSVAYNQVISGKVGQYNYVDLGLSVMWATCNLGSSKPSDSGQFFSWGEVTSKPDYTWITYTLLIDGTNKDNARFKKYNIDNNSGIVDNLFKLETTDDAAYVMWRDKWRMPTKEEFDELVINCTWKWTKVDGVPGYVITSKKRGFESNSIFLPAAGYYQKKTVQKNGERGCYWSSSLGNYSHSAVYLGFNSSTERTYNDERYIGRSIRPVCEK